MFILPLVFLTNSGQFLLKCSTEPHILHPPPNKGKKIRKREKEKGREGREGKRRKGREEKKQRKGKRKKKAKNCNLVYCNFDI